MNFQHLMITVAAFSLIYQASSQTYTPTDSLLSITTATDSSESYVDRTTDSTVAKSVEIRNAGASYTGENINITNNRTSASYGIYATSSKYISLTAADGTWNTITMNSGTSGIYLLNLSQTSTVSNTQVYMNDGTDSNGSAIVASSSALVLDNVNVYQSGSQSRHGIESTGSNAIVTNKDNGQVTIDKTGTQTGAALGATNGGSMDLYNTTINASSLSLGVMYVGAGGNISLTNSRISSSSGNMLVALIHYDETTAASTVTLNNVNLDNARNQQIRASGPLTVNLSNGTNFDGYTARSGGSIIFNINSRASWNVTRNSVANNLSLGAASVIRFEELSSGSFTNINSVNVALESGAILMLGASAEEIQALIDGNGGTYDVKLFQVWYEFNNDGVILMSDDNRMLEYTTDNMGTYTLTGVVAPVPEPSAAMFGLVAMGLTALRRRQPNRA